MLLLDYVYESITGYFQVGGLGIEEANAAEEKSLKETLQKLSYTIENGYPKFSDRDTWETDEGRLVARGMFKAKMAEEIFRLHLDGKQTNQLMKLLEDPSYENILKDISELVPNVSREFVAFVKSVIVDNQELQENLKFIVLQEVKRKHSRDLELDYAIEEIVRLKRRLVEQERIAVEKSSALEHAGAVNVESDSTGSALPSSSPPPPPPPPPPPKPEDMDDKVMFNYGSVLEQLRKRKHSDEGRMEAIAGLEGEKKKAKSEEHLSMLEQFRREKAERDAARSGKVTDQAVEPEPLEIRVLKVKMRMGENRITFENSNVDKANQVIANIEAAIRGLEANLERLTIGLEKKEVAGVVGKGLQPIKDEMEISNNELRKKNEELLRARQELEKETESLRKAQESSKKLEARLDEARESSLKRLEEAKVASA